MIDKLFSILDKFHSNKNIPITIQPEAVLNNYTVKLSERFKNKNDYPFADAEIVFKQIIDGINQYSDIKIVPFIHGDFWFSNILLTYDDEFKFIDMKGQVDGTLTISGDMYYDYGKLYQSILGYDLILNEIEIDIEYINKMKTFFILKCETIGLNLDYLKWITKGLIFGVFHSIEGKSNIKNRIWELIKSI